MIEIWEECARFQTKSITLDNLVRTKIKKDCLSDLKILEIHHQINRESRQQDPNTIIDPPNTEKQKHSNGNELQSNNNRNITQPTYTEQTLTQKEKVNRDQEENYFLKED